MFARSFSTEDKAIGFDFEFQLDEATEDIMVSFGAFWYYRRMDVFRMENRSTASTISFNHTFPSGDRLYGHIKGISFFDISTRDNAAIWGDFYYRYKNMDLGHFEGVMVSFTRADGEALGGPDEKPEPSLPAPITSDPLPAIVAPSHTEARNLFSYIYIHGWPGLDRGERSRVFVTFDPAAFPAQTITFYQELTGVTSFEQGIRAAVTFVEKNLADGGFFVNETSRLSAPLNGFARICARAREELPADETALFGLLGQGLDREKVKLLLTSEAWLSDLAKVWQSYFALVLLSGYRVQLFQDLALTLIFAHLLQDLMKKDAPFDIHLRLWARIALPTPTFPLVPGNGKSPSGGSLETFAIGDLQMVRQQLTRYEPGEIAEIVNLLRGERKEIVRRKRASSQVIESEGSDRTRTDHNSEREANENLQRAIAGTMCKHLVTHKYDNFNTSYGPPTTATLGGSFSIAVEPQEPGKEDETRFARQIITEAANRVADNISRSRVTTTLQETEECETRTYDNTNGQSNLVGVYRWVNKIYSATVVPYGTRLMLELILKKPASHYIGSESDMAGTSLDEPLSLQEQGIKTYEDLGEENFALLAARYRIREPEPCPASQQIISATLQSETEKLIPVPKGYTAEKARVSCVIPSGATNPSVQGLVGSRAFTFQANGELELTLGGQDREVPIVLVQPDETTTVAGKYVVTVEITCSLSPAALRQWQIKAWCDLLAAWEKAREDYDRRTGVGPLGQAMESGPKWAEVERRELKKGCMDLFLERYRSPSVQLEVLGSGVTPGEVFYSRLERMFEWPEMDYSLHADWSDPTSPQGVGSFGDASDWTRRNGDDSPFIFFLQAGIARILLPVKPRFNLPVLYYLSSGNLWMNAPEWTPVHELDLALVNQLDLMRCEQKEEPAQTSWEFALPTNMQVLEQHSHLGNLSPSPSKTTPQIEVSHEID